ncbi:artemin [Emydura macquarii macquarii]|uniref:artemin n=1 Tax=Emydura macquarii macquarii TaxID=1129001 RepID=UPI00352AEB69
MRPPRRQEGADSMPARGWCPGAAADAAQPGAPEHGGMEQTAGGPASPPTKTLRQRPRGGTLWGALAILSLLTGVAAGAPQSWCHNTTLGAALPAAGMGTASPGAEGSMEAPLAAAWRHRYGASVPAGGPGETELAEDLLLRVERSPKKGARTRNRPGKNQSHNCSVRSLLVKVRDLGLGFDSDEIVRFKYCSGSCHRRRGNYDLTLASLLQEKLIAPGALGHVASQPCCRPSRYESVSFMNVQHAWQTVEQLSAAECKCVG